MLKLFRYLKPYALFVTAILVLVFLQTLSDLYLPTLMSDIVNHGIMQGDTDYILKTGGKMLLFVGGSVLSAVIASYLSSVVAAGFGRDLRQKLFRQVEGFSLHEFDKFGTSTLITRTTNDITQVQNVTLMILRMMVMAPIMAIGSLILALSKDKPLTLVLVVALPVLIGTIALLAKKGMPLFQSIQTKIDQINLVLRENLTGIRVIRAFNRVDDEKARFEQANADLTGTYIKVNQLMAILFPIVMLLMNITAVSLYWFGSIRISTGGMDMGALIAFTQYAMQLMFSFIMVTMMFIMVPRAQAAAVRINEVIDVVPEIKEPEVPVQPGSERGHVEFRDVTFAYHGAEQPAVSGISFEAKPGETTAIIGGTGSGKSTLVNLIPRFYDASNGVVLVDGVDVRRMAQQDLRARIGYVPQKTVLFKGTIADNIRFGSEETEGLNVEQAAETAQATEFISTIENGFEHEIAQGGTNVSGGQKQRLSIARALARKPEIYIFDDSFSALDFKTDAKLRGALKQYTTDSTVFIISQRVSTVMDADNIIVLDDGQIAGMGKHRDLLKSCEVYREIAASQLSEEELA